MSPECDSHALRFIAMQMLANKRHYRRNDTPPAAAGYIGSMSRELARMARTDGCETLSYLLELVAIEADTIIGVPEGYRVS